MTAPRPGASLPRRLHGRRWLVVAALIVGSGFGASFLAAHAVAKGAHNESHRALVTASAGVASRLRLAIQHEEDLVISASAFVAANPTISNARYKDWARADRVFARYPELLGLGRIVIVAASALPAYAAHAKLDPAVSLAPDGSFQVIPAGRRPFYCFIDLSAARVIDGPTASAGSDLCADPQTAATLVAARDSGLGSYTPYPIGKITALVVDTPVYRGGVVPKTVAGRRAAFLGLIANGLTPQLVLSTALDGHRHMAVTLQHGRGAGAVTYEIGKAPRTASSLSVDLHNGWSIRTAATVAGASVLSNTHAMTILSGGIALSLLLGLLIVVLATGRMRALRLVGAQTVELTQKAAALRETVEELQLAHSVKDDFIALVSHELRTPLTSIRGYADLLLDEPLDDDQHTYVAVIDRNATRLLTLVEDLLIMAQLQSGGLPLANGRILLNDLIARSGEVARPLAASKDIDLDIEVAPDIATNGDAVRLGQVIDNLVSNAIKYTPNGGGVSIRMTSDGGTASIAISDTGIGIPAGESDKMFGRFFRTTNARASGIQGSGLGLAISRGIVEAHGGTIGFDSVEGTGTTFHVTLPLQDAGLEAAA